MASHEMMPVSRGTLFRDLAAGLVAQWRMLLIGSAAVLGVTGRLTYGWTAPLWFDETFSGVIAGQSTVRALIAWCLTELTGPAFYVPLWAWEKVAGSSDAALRAPSLFFSLAAPVLLYWRGHPDREVRLFWAALVLLWLPAMSVATEARPYPQLFFLASVQAIAFLGMMREPRRSRALVWTTATALMILTNYHALEIGGIQGVIYLARHRRAALSTWPATLPFLAVAAWMAVHVSFVLSFAGSHTSAYGSLPLSQLILLPALLFGISLYGTIILGAIGASLAMAMRAGGRAPAPLLDPDRLLAFSGIAAFGLMFAMAFLRPGFAPRYVTPCMPAILFGMALWVRAQLRRDAKPVVVVFAMMILMAGGLIRSNLTETDVDGRHLFNLELPSSWLAEREPKRLVYFWDGPIGAISGSDHMAAVAGFFFRRDGQPISVVVVRASKTEDPNRVVLAAADQDKDAAILWMANDSLPFNREPRVSTLDSRWECRDFGGGQVVNTACRHRP